MDSQTFETLSVLKWKLLNGDSKKQLTSEWRSYIISNKQDVDDVLIESINRICKCGKRIAFQYAQVYKALKISGTKIKMFAGK